MPGPDIWGPPGWKFIHYVTLGYPNSPSEDIKKKYYNYFHALKYVIPCSICAAHFADNLERYPLTAEVLSNRDNLIKWGIDVHNSVNRMNNKKEYSYEEGLYTMLNGFNDKPNNNIVIKEKQVTSMFPLLISAVIILILLVIIYCLINKKIVI